MTKFKYVLVFLIIFLPKLTLSSQTFLSVDLNEPVYKLIEIAEIKGLINNLTQARPYSNATILSFLNTINTQRSQLTSLERTVLDSALGKYTPASRDITLLNTIKEGKVHFNSDEESLFPMEIGLSFDFETRGDLNTASVHSTNYVTAFLKGDISTFSSYNLNLAVALNTIDFDAFAPYTYTKRSADGYYIETSGGIQGNGYTDGNKGGASFSFLLRPEFNFSFFDERFSIGYSRKRRDVGNGIGNFTISSTARPYDGIDLKFRPATWFNLYFTVGALNDWFYGFWRYVKPRSGYESAGGDVAQTMITSQLLELMPFDWFYFSYSNSIVWAKRFELVYMNPLLPPLLAQSLTGDHDNAAMEFSMAFKIPLGLKLHGTFYLDELRGTEGLKTDPVMPFALQGGIKWVVPKLPFTIVSFQYTKIEPYTYGHYPENYPFFDTAVDFNVSWTNDGENLGYHLPPNSDEFLIKIEAMPYKRLMLAMQYQYIRHGDGDPHLGQMEGSIDAGSFDPTTGNTKNFLNDGIYELIHIGTIGASYEFDEIPIRLMMDYSFTYANNYENIPNNTKIINSLAMKIHLFP